MSIIHGIVLGLIQGLGEFLPISSSGHLLLAQLFLGIRGDTPELQSAMKLLDIMLHFGTLLPVIIIFRKDWIDMICHPVRNKTLVYLLTASLPTLIIYLTAKFLFPSFDGFSVFDSGWFLGPSFLLTSLFLFLCDIKSSRSDSKERNLGIFNALVMGFFQGIGLIPGVSRSGSSILGGVYTGLTKKKAARFSFMMSAPAILGSLLLEGKDMLKTSDVSGFQWIPALVGITVAAFSGFIAIKSMIKMIEKIPLGYFALYLGIIGIVYLVFQLAGVSFLPAFSPTSTSLI